MENQFCEITGADHVIAQSFLSMCDGDIDKAIELYFETPSSSRTTKDSCSLDSEIDKKTEDWIPKNSRDAINEDQVRAPIPSRHEKLFAEDAYQPRSHRNLPVAESLLVPQNIFPEDSRLGQLFKAPLDIMFLGTFETAKDLAMQQQMLLLVNLQDTSDFSCQMLNRDLWRKEEVKGFVKNNLVFLQLCTDNQEGHRYRRYYPVEEFPHISLIDPRTGERVKIWTKVLSPEEFINDVSEYQGKCPFDDTVDDSTKSTEENTDTPKRRREEELFNEEKCRKKIDSVEPENSIPIPTAENSNEVENFHQKIVVPIVCQSEPSESSANTTKIQFRLPNGHKLIRRFYLHDPIRYMWDFLKSDCSFLHDKHFELRFHTSTLHNGSTSISDAGLQNASLSVVIDQ